MRRCTRLLWGVTLAAFLTGCGGWRQVGLPPAGVADGTAAQREATPTAEVGRGVSRLVRRGMTVRVTMRDGARHQGTVLARTQESLVLAAGDTATTRVMLPADEIARIEARPERGAEFAVASVLLLLFAGLYGLSTMSDRGW